MGHRNGAMADVSVAWFLIFLLSGYTSRLVSDICDILMRWFGNDDEDHEFHLGSSRMVPEQCTDHDTDVPYLGHLMWQEQREQLEASHARLLAYRSHNHCQPTDSGSETRGRHHERPKEASVDVATQTMQDLPTGTMVDGLPTVMVPNGVTNIADGTTDMHGAEPAGDAELPENHPASMAVERAPDSGYGSEPLASQNTDQNQAEDEKLGEACYIPGVSVPTRSHGNVPDEPDKTDGKPPRKMDPD